jgi:hypothetical protein
MSGVGNRNEPGELVYVPEPTWYPVLFAAGLAGVLVSLFTWWPYGVVGGAVAIVALIAMIRHGRQDFDRLPRSQRITPGQLPPATLKR